MKKYISAILIITMLSFAGAVPVAAETVRFILAQNTNRSISAGFYNAAAITNAGNVWTWGFNEKGALGNGNYENQFTPQRVNGVSGAVSVDIGLYNTVVLHGDGSVYVMGNGEYGQYGKMPVSTTTPKKVNGISGIVDVMTSHYCKEIDGVPFTEPYIIALSGNGDVYSWGANKTGVLGTGDFDNRITPTKVPGIGSVVEISVNGPRVVTLKSDGTVWQWGYIGSDSYYGNAENEWFTNVPVQVPGLSGIVSVASGSTHALALKNDGTVYGWGNNSSGQLCQIEGGSNPAVITGLPKVTRIYAEAGYSLFVAADGKLYGAGNACHMFSEDIGFDSEFPVLIPAPLDFVRLALSHTMILALTTDNNENVYAWGEAADFGSFGSPEQESSSTVPVQSNISNVKIPFIDFDESDILDGRELGIINPKITNSAGQEISTVQETMKISVGIGNRTSEERQITAIAAVYERSATGYRMNNITISNFALNGSEYINKMIDLNVRGFAAENEYTVNLFIWNQLDILNPYYKKAFPLD